VSTGTYDLHHNADQISGGPAGLIYGFLLVWLGNISVFIAIGELSSAIPTAGGQYHWVSLLAPRSCKRFFSYITGERRPVPSGCIEKQN
jgi:amino acid transporter